MREVNKMNKEYLKKSGQELQDYLAFRRRGSTVRAKKGKGSYSRKIKNKKEW
jgi:stalled ribosome alternative rescue factor ArfA